MDITLKLKQFIKQELMPYLDETVDLDSLNLLSQGLDSIKIMRLIYFIEKIGGITIPNDQIEPKHFATLQTIVDLIQQLIMAKELC